MLKLLGAGLTILSCSAVGFLICANMKKRIRTLEELRRMTVMLSAEIRCGGVLLEESFAGIAGRVKPPVQTFLLHLQAREEEQYRSSHRRRFHYQRYSFRERVPLLCKKEIRDPSAKQTPRMDSSSSEFQQMDPTSTKQERMDSAGSVESISMSDVSVR